MDQNRQINKWLAIIIFVMSLFIYLITIAPDVSFWDCGEFIACSYTMSVMHPPGAPMYTILGRLFTFIPISNIAWRINFLSALAAALTVMLLYLIIVRMINAYRGQPKTGNDRILAFGSAIIGAMTFAFTDSHWFNAVEAEVYGISMLFTALVVWLILYWGDNAEDVKSERYLLLIVYLMGLATGIHMLNLLAFAFILLIVHFRNNNSAKRLTWVILIQAAVPIFLYILIFNYDYTTKNYPDMLAHQASAGNFLMIVAAIILFITLYYLYSKDRKAFYLWWFLPALMIIGYSSYLIIFIRSGLNPPIDENNPEVWSSMMDYLARKQYGENSLLLTMFSRKSDFIAYQINKMYVRYFSWQFVGKGTTFGSDGYITEIFSIRGLLMIPFMVGIVGAYYQFRRDWKHALPVLILFLVTGIGVILYLNQQDPQPRERDYAYEGSFFAFSIWIGIGVYALIEIVQSFLAERKGLLKPATWGGFAVLTIILPLNMCRVNFESHDRSGNYVPYDYSYNILQTCEPGGIVFTNGDNDTFPLWYLQYVQNVRPDVRVVNLSLLNTSWYIQQLKDDEPRINIPYTDSQIEAVEIDVWPEPRKVSIDVSNQVYEKEKKDMQERGEWKDSYLEPGMMEFTVKPTVGGNPKQFIRVQDQMVMLIIAANQWKRPIYFAVTVSDENKIGLGQNLRMDGMAFKVVPYPNQEISSTRLHENLFNKFKFRNLDNPDVYMNEKTQGLLINYRSAFLRLADFYRRTNNKNMVIATLDKMEELIPEAVVPIPDDRLVLSIGRLYDDAGKQGEFERRLKDVFARDPNNIQTIFYLLDFYQRNGRFLDAINILDQWLELHPNDPNAMQLRMDFQNRLAEQDSVGVDSSEVDSLK